MDHRPGTCFHRLRCTRTTRGADPAETGHYPQDRLFIQRTTMPINLLCNEELLKRGNHEPCVQASAAALWWVPTHGSVISTGSFSLEDGTTVRMPFRGWYVADQNPRDMELNGAIPDLLVPQTLKMNPLRPTPNFRSLWKIS